MATRLQGLVRDDVDFFREPEDRRIAYGGLLEVRELRALSHYCIGNAVRDAELRVDLRVFPQC